MKRKLINLLLTMTLTLCACTKDATTDTITKDVTEELGETTENKEIVSEAEKLLTWQESYIDIIKSIPQSLSDPYHRRDETETNSAETTLYIYLRIHDFDNNDIPELIIGDGISLAVFTYENGDTKKVADLCTPESWGGIINGVHLKNNRMLLEVNGSDGCGFTSFGFVEGEYKTGYYDEYNPSEIIVDGKKADLEAFNAIYDIENTQNWSDDMIWKVCLKKEGEEWKIVFEDNVIIPLDQTFDFEKIRR